MSGPVALDQILGLSLPSADGRPLLEALQQNGADAATYTVTEQDVAPAAPASGLTFRLPTSPAGVDHDAALTAGSYSLKVHTKTVSRAGTTSTYFDLARPVRQ